MNCFICDKPFTKEVLKHLAQERLRRSDQNLDSHFHSLILAARLHMMVKDEAPKAVEIFEECVGICQHLLGKAFGTMKRLWLTSTSLVLFGTQVEWKKPYKSSTCSRTNSPRMASETERTSIC
jgi:hypothetical protein